MSRFGKSAMVWNRRLGYVCTTKNKVEISSLHVKNTIRNDTFIVAIIGDIVACSHLVAATHLRYSAVRSESVKTWVQENDTMGNINLCFHHMLN